MTSEKFEIASLTKEDEGTYACIASNLAGQTEERVQIIVFEEDDYYNYPDQSEGTFQFQSYHFWNN